MRSIHSIMAAIAISALLTSCATEGRSPTQLAANAINRQSITPTTHDTYPAKNPQTVSLYTADQKPNAAYRIIGIVKVSQYNLLGAKREDETLHSMMKKLAAGIGGDGVININRSNDEIQANVIAYQRILI